MIKYDDREIDEILWSAIEHSDSAADFAAYLKHKPEGAAHIDDAKKRFHVLADGKFDNTGVVELAICQDVESFLGVINMCGPLRLVLKVGSKVCSGVAVFNC